MNEVLGHCHISCGRPLGTIFNVKCDPVTFVERFESGGVYCRMMYEYIRSIFLLNKTKPLLSLNHFTIPFAMLTFS